MSASTSFYLPLSFSNFCFIRGHTGLYKYIPIEKFANDDYGDLQT